MSLRPLWSLFSVRLFSPVYSVGVASWSWRNFISPCCVCVYTQDNKNISDRVTVFHQNTPTFLLVVFISRNFSLAHRLWFELRLYSLRCSDLPPLVSLFLPELPEHSHRRWPKRNKLTLSPRFTTERLAPTEHNASTIVILFKSGDLNLAELRELNHRREINAARWGQINLIMPGSWVKLKQTSTMLSNVVLSSCTRLWNEKQVCKRQLWHETYTKTTGSQNEQKDAKTTWWASFINIVVKLFTKLSETLMRVHAEERQSSKLPRCVHRTSDLYFTTPTKLYKRVKLKQLKWQAKSKTFSGVKVKKI